MGLRHVEAFNFVGRAAELAEAFTRHGLAAKTGHATFSDERRRGDTVIPTPPRRTSSRRRRPSGSTSSSTPSSAPTAGLTKSRWGHRRPAESGGGARREYGPRGYHNHTQEFAASSAGARPSRCSLSSPRRRHARGRLYWAATAKQDVPLCWVVLGIVSRLCM